MTSQLERIEYELKKAGFDLKDREEIKTEDDYSQAIGTSVWKVCKVFCSHDHSGFSAKMALNMLKALLIEGKPLSPLTNDPKEWTDISVCSTEMSSGSLYQSKRNFSCFSDDGLKTYYDIDAEENIEYELDENGNRTGGIIHKPSKEMKRIALVNLVTEDEGK